MCNKNAPWTQKNANQISSQPLTARSAATWRPLGLTGAVIALQMRQKFRWCGKDILRSTFNHLEGVDRVFEFSADEFGIGDLRHDGEPRLANPLKPPDALQ